MSTEIDISRTTGATTTRMQLTEHGTAHITEKCGLRSRELYVPLELLEVFMACYKPTDRRSVSVKEAAALAGVSKRSIYNWMEEGKLEWYRNAGGNRRICSDTLARKP